MHNPEKLSFNFCQLLFAKNNPFFLGSVWGGTTSSHILGSSDARDQKHEYCKLIVRY